VHTLLETKLYVPRPRGSVVPRPRLTERLERGAAGRLLIVSAPAGFGKTTLLTEWLTAQRADGAERADGADRLDQAERRVAWLSLDAADNEAASFWSYVIAALRTADPGAVESARSLLDDPQGPQA
jgi:LuxR family maltose regulon positive regulatory protein